MRIVVFTCDEYSWLIPTFWHFYRKNWKDNPYKTEFVTETKEIKFGDAVFYGGKMPWVDRAIKYLKQLDDDKFLLMLDDYILESSVDSHKVKIAENLCENDVGCVKLTAHDEMSKFLVDTDIEGFKKYPLDKPYSVSLQVAIWQKSFFLDILKSGENIWETEVNGSKRMPNFHKQVLWPDTPAISYSPSGYMKKGAPVEAVVKWVKENW